jgi:CheY-like chemotaxis protein
LARKVLLADDSVTAQNMGRRILVEAGYEVITVNNGSSALKKVTESKPDLIVLDVYMPGYGGLEVCQRIRESQETARIPVLLTVGKLEPFKAGEAQRVRADAFIVKPFEASELLTALTKLEDKIVPQPSGRRSNRKSFVDEESELNKEFGDLESGWKNRLKIPPPHHPRTHDKVAGSESESASAKVREERNEVEAPVPSETQQESKPRQPAEIAPSADERHQAGQESSEFSLRVDERANEVAASEVKHEESATAVADARIGWEPASMSSAVPEVIKAWPETALNGQRKSHEDELAAALASLAPSKEDASEVIASEPVPVTIAAAVGGREYSGPRWAAQEIALTNEESSLILDQEMHKAFAAFAAVDAARMSGSAAAEEFRTESSPPQQADLAASATSHGMESTAEEAESHGSASETQESLPPVPIEATVPVAPENAVEQPEETTAYAAAASAGAGAGPAASTEAVSHSAVAPEGSTPGESRVDSDLAAAWASWKQVRESFSGPEFTSQITDSAANGFKEIGHEEPTTQPESVSSSTSAEENGAIASIVDSVLAELKPKLMEEIAKKMKKEKQKQG